MAGLSYTCRKRNLLPLIVYSASVDQMPVVSSVSGTGGRDTYLQGEIWLSEQWTFFEEIGKEVDGC